MTTENLTAPLVLHLAQAGEATPVDAGDRPTSLHGLPVKYLWKEVIRCGNYTHPATGQKIEVTPQRLEKWETNFRKMQSNGVKVYSPVNHSRKTEDNRGYAIDARRVGDRLELLHQLIGDDAIRDAARSEISVRIVPNFKDGAGNVYDEAIEHSSWVLDPVIPAQTPAIAASRGDAIDGPVYLFSASYGKAAMKCSDDYVEKVKGTLGPDLSKDVTPENAHEMLLAHHEAVANDADKAELSRQNEELTVRNDELEQAIVSLSAERDSLKAQATELSRQSDNALTEREIVFGRKAVNASADKAVASGGITPATRKAIDELLTPAISLSVSGGGGDLLGAKLYDILAANKAVDLSQRTGVQTLSRVTPNDDPADPKPAGELPYHKWLERRNAATK